jgi:hypothetical protein
MPIATLRPNERYAFIGKTRAGKTQLAIVLAATFARALPAPWEVWWIDTKNDGKDIKTLRTWGFRNAASNQDRQTSLLQNALYYYVPASDDKFDPDTVEQVQAICSVAFRRRNVIVCIDEYTQAVVSQKNAGAALLNIFTRGGGRDVGIIGLTQEPVYVPRQLISQSTHQILLNVTYEYDIKYLKGIDPAYVPPRKLGDDYGFWWRWSDGSGELIYYPNQKIWYDQLEIALPRNEQPQEV